MSLRVAHATRTPISGGGQHVRRLPGVVMAPALYSLLYLVGTFFIFLLSNLTREVDNMVALCTFVGFAYLGLYLGYWLGALSDPTPSRTTSVAEYGRTSGELWLVLAGALYFALWGVNQIYEFGGGSLDQVIQSVLSPGDSYRSKFDIYEMRLATGRVSRVTQMLILLSILYGIAIPLGLACWKRIPGWLRLSLIGSMLIYIVSFLFIGTMKGVGDVFLFAITGLSVLLAKQSLKSRVPVSRTGIWVIIALLGVALFTYMVSNQIDRASTFGIAQSRIVGDVSDTWIARSFGNDIAYGFYTVLAYPSHGYLGLSYNLQQPFEFSYGAGISPAFESYRAQFFGGESLTYLTYPHRTEAATGWPAGMYWATIFPWLASDVTFFLTPFLMALIGFAFARVWIACVFGRSVLALVALGQLIVFVAFIPANNQVLMNRQGLWVLITLLALWAYSRIRSHA